MSRNLLPLSLTATLIAWPALAEVPRVAVDIAPVHSLVARVMGDLGAPDLIIPAGASPHEYSLRPSEAAALQDADIVFWTGEDLTPWLEGAIETLASDASVTALLESDGTRLLATRENAQFEAHDHDHGDETDDHAENGDHEDDQAHAESEGHDHEEDGHDEHDHGDNDPHAWLSPENAASWLTVIAAQLSAVDPENAGVYSDNAADARAELKNVISDVNAILHPVRGGKFILFHDAYQYFETAFDFPASGAISISDASEPSPSRLAEIQALVSGNGIACVLSEPQFNEGFVAAVVDGTQAKTAVLDPLGSDLDPGVDLYGNLLRSLATVLADCLS